MNTAAAADPRRGSHTASISARAERGRIVNVVRMHLLNKQTFVWLPGTILLATFAITMAVYGVILYSVGGTFDPPTYSGGAQAPLWYFLVVGVQALAYTFPFSQAMSVTRREYYVGTMATAAATAASLAVLYLAVGAIEQATDGWGFHGYTLYLPWVWSQGTAVAGLLYFAVAMLAFTIGFWAATVYKRFGATWVVALGIGIAALLVIAALLIGVADGWPAVGRWLADLRPAELFGLVVAVEAVLATLAFATIRRATP